MSKFYLCGAWHRKVNQAQMNPDHGIHGTVDFMTEALPYLRERGYAVQQNIWPLVERPGANPYAAFWGAFFERDGATLERFLKAAPQFLDGKRWLIYRFHAAFNSQITRLRRARLDKANVLLGTHQVVVDDLRRNFPDHPHIYVCPYGVATFWEYPPPQPDPYDHSVKNLVFSGRLDTSSDLRRVPIFKKIYERDPTVKIHIITQSVRQGALDPADLPPNCVCYGQLQSGTFNHLLYYADLALDTVQFYDQRCLNCKNYAYLGMGLPVVAHIVPGIEPHREIEHGIFLHPSRPDDEYVDAVFEALQRSWSPRDTVIRWAQENHGWDKSAEVLRKCIQLGLDEGYGPSD